mmetsp:Transcript_27644/g.91856  ORF Transcript_27644/g.91856 Transcript_27644/m.91856 type:complete len:350 (+) Transcript_27644:582-1631(+)
MREVAEVARQTIHAVAGDEVETWPRAQLGVPNASWVQGVRRRHRHLRFSRCIQCNGTLPRLPRPVWGPIRRFPSCVRLCLLLRRLGAQKHVGDDLIRNVPGDIFLWSALHYGHSLLHGVVGSGPGFILGPSARARHQGNHLHLGWSQDGAVRQLLHGLVELLLRLEVRLGHRLSDGPLGDVLHFRGQGAHLPHELLVCGILVCQALDHTVNTSPNIIFSLGDIHAEALPHDVRDRRQVFDCTLHIGELARVRRRLEDLVLNVLDLALDLLPGPSGAQLQRLLHRFRQLLDGRQGLPAALGEEVVLDGLRLRADAVPQQLLAASASEVALRSLLVPVRCRGSLQQIFTGA